MIEKKLIEEIDILKKYRSILEDINPLRPMGKVSQVGGMAIFTEGPPEVSIGDICRVEVNDGAEYLNCEVVGFQGHRLVLMPLGPLTGVFPKANVLATGRRMTIPVGDHMLGRILDGNGRPLDNKAPLISAEGRFSDYDPPDPHERIPIRQPVETGVRAIDGMLTVGRGQRIGIFAGTGVGKSTLLGMIARYTKADINVICLVGERGREVREFIETDLGELGLQNSVIFVATSDKSAMEKVNCAGFAASAAEYFRDKGLHVNFMMDSLTRFCMAQREVGLSSGDQIGPGGYPPAVWYKLSRLVERSGNMGAGSVTGFYTVLVEADDMNDPVADNARGVLDGHIVLSRRLAQKGHYPSIEVTDSISRVMDKVVTPEHKQFAHRLRALMAAYRENEELINLGAYARGSNVEVDEAIEKLPAINQFLRQDVEEGSQFELTERRLRDLVEAREEEYY